MDRASISHRGALTPAPARGDDPIVKWRGGVHITGTPLYCDTRREGGLCFVSSGQVSLPGWPQKLLCTERTLRMLCARRSGRHPHAAALTSPFGRPFSLGGLRLELFPAGFLPGSASLLVVLREERRIVYCGQINPQAGDFCEEMQVRAADTLVCAAPVAALSCALPSRAAAREAVRRHMRAALDDGVTAVFLAPSQGTAQDLLEEALSEGLPLLSHRRILHTRRLYEEMQIIPSTARPAPRGGASVLPSDRAIPEGSLVLWPIEESPARLLPLVQGDRTRPRLYVVTAAAVSEEALSRHLTGPLAQAVRCEGVPYPDSIDLPGLLRYVRMSEARVVYLTAGYSEALARAFADLAVQVFPLGPPRQLDLFAG